MYIQPRRNAFLALAVLANRERWCWNLGCTTCGHLVFRHGLQELVRGVHPDSTRWQLHQTEERHMPERFVEMPQRLTQIQQALLLGIVSQVDIKDLKQHCRFPDWLGFIGVILDETREAEDTTRILTKSLVPQLIDAVERDTDRERLVRSFTGERVLRWEDLEAFEPLLGRDY